MTTPLRIEDFQLLEKIGSGTYASVYRCFRKGTKEREYLAIKCVDKAKLSKSAVDNIITEIRLLKSLKHKHIVEMRDFLWDEKHIYILMELCSSGDLSAYIKQHRKLPELTCRYFLRQLSAALQYMRANHVSHFDLKPQNLLITKTPQLTLKVADFGFAQHLKSGDQNTSVKGSPLYMAPEILLKRCYNAKADLWSIGVILYECLFGQAPYQSKSINELIDKIEAQQRIDIPKTASISSECLDLLARLLQHDPDKRIDFEDYFQHQFLDLSHFPDEENFEKARRIVTQAVQKDTEGHFEEAYHLYCESLQYFIPIVSSATNGVESGTLRLQIKSYLDRAEEIKRTSLMMRSTSNHSTQQQEEGAGIAKEPVQSLGQDKGRLVKNALTPSPLYRQLFPLTASSPAIRSALEIGRKGELYIFERNFKEALASFTSALGQLVPLLGTEPKGTRRDMMHQITQFWMKEAESLKAILKAQDWTSSDLNNKIRIQMMHYRKGKNVDEQLTVESVPIDNLPKDFLWMKVNGGTKLTNVVDYAVKAVKSGEYRSVLWTGSGGGVSKTVSCAEIMKRDFEMDQITRIKYSLTEEDWDPQTEGLDAIVVKRYIPTIFIYQSLDEIDPNELGYQNSKTQTGMWLDRPATGEKRPGGGKSTNTFKSNNRTGPASRVGTNNHSNGHKPGNNRKKGGCGASPNQKSNEPHQKKKANELGNGASSTKMVVSMKTDVPKE